MLCSYALYSQGCQADKSKVTSIPLYIQNTFRQTVEGPEETNLSNFHRVLGRTSGVVLNFVPLDDFFKPEINTRGVTVQKATFKVNSKLN